MNAISGFLSAFNIDLVQFSSIFESHLPATKNLLMACFNINAHWEQTFFGHFTHYCNLWLSCSRTIFDFNQQPLLLVSVQKLKV